MPKRSGAVLRKARCQELSERHDGVVVEGGGGGAPFLVARAGEDLAAGRGRGLCAGSYRGRVRCIGCAPGYRGGGREEP